MTLVQKNSFKTSQKSNTNIPTDVSFEEELGSQALINFSLDESLTLSDVSMNAPHIKDKYLTFISNSQEYQFEDDRSVSSSMNDPVVKDAYIKFLAATESKKKYKKKAPKRNKTQSGNKKQVNSQDSGIVLELSSLTGSVKSPNTSQIEQFIEDSLDNVLLKIKKHPCRKAKKQNNTVDIFIDLTRDDLDEAFDLSVEKITVLIKQNTNIGIWVHCDNCDKLRYLKDVHDPTEMGEFWYCRENPDKKYANCNVPQMEISPETQSKFLENIYCAGSVVWAYQSKFKLWWPAMVDYEPYSESFYLLQKTKDMKPKWYNVTYFNSQTVARKWLVPNQIKPFRSFVHQNETVTFDLQADLNIAECIAEKVINLPPLERLCKFSFVYKFEKRVTRSAKNTPVKRLADKRK